MKIPLLMNTRAGALHQASGPDEFLRIAAKEGVDIDLIRTNSAEEMTSKAKKLVDSGAERIGVAGGDGTAELVIQVLAGTDTALGIISQGTFNNFASTLRIPHNLPAALRMLRDGQATSVDLGKVNNRYFTESVGVGLFADGLAMYGQGSNKNFGRGLYAMAGIALSFRPKDLSIVVDGKTIDEPVVLCEVANTYRIAQAVPIAPYADVCDGLLDVVIFKDVRRHEILGYLKALRAQVHGGLPKVEILQGKRIELRSTKKRNVHADDDILGQLPVSISVQPGALKVLADPSI